MLNSLALLKDQSCFYITITYLAITSSSVDKVTQVLLSSLDVHELTIHAMRVFEEFWRSCQTQMDILPLEKVG